jgi:acetyl esterase
MNNPINEGSANELYALIGKIRSPLTFRELIAVCLRSIYMGDPFTRDEGNLPSLPSNLVEEVTVTERQVGSIRCTIYSPLNAKAEIPLMLYMHGGGFVVGCSEDTDYVTRSLCYSNQIVVVSVNYRLAPETVFPGALIDCEEVLNSVIEVSSELGIDINSIYLAGDSAGGNLAVALFQQAQQLQPSIRGLVLFAPWLDMEVEKYESYNRLAPTGIVFDSAFIGYARGAYTKFEEWKSPLVSPINLTVTKLPPTIILIGTEDPLLDQALCFRQIAEKAGCSNIEIEVYSNMPHCFYSFPSLFTEEVHCYERVSKFIRKTLMQA